MIWGSVNWAAEFLCVCYNAQVLVPTSVYTSGRGPVSWAAVVQPWPGQCTEDPDPETCSSCNTTNGKSTPISMSPKKHQKYIYKLTFDLLYVHVDYS